MSSQGTSRSPSPAVGSSTLVAFSPGNESRQRTMRLANAGGVRTKAELARLAKVPCGIYAQSTFPLVFCIKEMRDAPLCPPKAVGIAGTPRPVEVDPCGRGGGALVLVS